MERRKLLQRRKHVVTRDNIEKEIEWVVTVANVIGGPRIRPDKKRGFGLFADRDYATGEKVTTYGGIISQGEKQGDYVALLGDGVHIDGAFGFTLEEKGRWINESDRDRTVVNVKLGRDIRTVRLVKQGEQFFADYGPEYVREY